MAYGLNNRDTEHIIAAIKTFDEIDEVLLFGSRAKGNYKKGSDVDLAIKGENITHRTVTQLSYLLNEEKPLPYYFDIVHFEKINEPKLTAHIDRVGVVFYTAKK